eukprot:1142859-Pelagomonas_calceolata.AAC.13
MSKCGRGTDIEADFSSRCELHRGQPIWVALLCFYTSSPHPHHRHRTNTCRHAHEPDQSWVQSLLGKEGRTDWHQDIHVSVLGKGMKQIRNKRHDG